MEPRLSLWDDLLAVDRLRRSEVSPEGISFASVANGLSRIAKDRGEWCGLPMPLNGEGLVIEPNHPHAEGLEKCGLGRRSLPIATRPRAFKLQVDNSEHPRLRNTFHSWHHRSDIDIWEVNGKIAWNHRAQAHNAGLMIRTMGCADAWALETEFKAMETLRSLVSLHQFRQYFLTGTFIESSKRSAVRYIFRRLRPTIAIGTAADGDLKILCALCLHPIAYYDRTYAGAMCPTDDVLAHLMLMRGDEKMFWRRSNQHPYWRPEAGL